MQTLTGKSVHTQSFRLKTRYPTDRSKSVKKGPSRISRPRVMFGLFGFGFAIADFSPCLINQGSEFEFITYEFNTQ